MKYLDPSYVDALVVSVRMINTRVKRVMINLGSSTNILYFDTFLKTQTINKRPYPYDLFVDVVY